MAIKQINKQWICDEQNWKVQFKLIDFYINLIIFFMWIIRIFMKFKICSTRIIDNISQPELFIKDVVILKLCVYGILLELYN